MRRRACRRNPQQRGKKRLRPPSSSPCRDWVASGTPPPKAHSAARCILVSVVFFWPRSLTPRSWRAWRVPSVAGGGCRRVATADATEPQGGSARIVGLVVLPGARGGSGARDGGAARTTAAHRLLPWELAAASCGRPAGSPPWKSPWSGTRGACEVSEQNGAGWGPARCCFRRALSPQPLPGSAGGLRRTRLSPTGGTPAAAVRVRCYGGAGRLGWGSAARSALGAAGSQRGVTSGPPETRSLLQLMLSHVVVWS